jgi:hypothetical protein
VSTPAFSPYVSLGIGNFTNAPLFVNEANGNFRLDPPSPCINTGYNPYAAGSTDFDGNPRIVSGTLDIGAYEYQGTGSVISYAWLQQYGWPVDGSADHTDADSDGMDNWQEWICGTEPTNALSSLTILAPSNSISGVTVRWRGVYGRTYFLECSPDLNLQPGFAIIQSNIAGRNGTISFADTNATGPGPYFYRVRVQQ